MFIHKSAECARCTIVPQASLLPEPSAFSWFFFLFLFLREAETSRR